MQGAWLPSLVRELDFHMPAPKSLHATTKTSWRQINIYIKKKKDIILAAMGLKGPERMLNSQGRGNDRKTRRHLQRCGKTSRISHIHLTFTNQGRFNTCRSTKQPVSTTVTCLLQLFSSTIKSAVFNSNWAGSDWIGPRTVQPGMRGVLLQAEGGKLRS